MIYSRLISIKLSQFYNSGYKFIKLTQIDLSFFMFLFNDFLILILYFEIRFIKKIIIFLI